MFKIRRKALLALGLAGAVGAPLLLSSTGGIVDSVSNGWKSLTGGSAEKPPTASTADVQNPNRKPWEAVPPQPLTPRIEGIPVQDIGDVLRFDVTPGWIMSRWSRVSTLPSGALQGYRVPLVTGTSEHDLAGALTYYFDYRQQVQRIKFVGRTGDPARLVALVTARFQFAAVRSNEPGTFLYQIRWNNRPTSELRIRTAEMLRLEAPNSRFDIDLEINLPDGHLSRTDPATAGTNAAVAMPLATAALANH
jgi:hypothetical protein